ncbi:MAG: heavy metal-responsive transcriptional regulator, partial [Pseudonocardia sp.]|nr:heavy metal-responsive transcriptional regulator [Pseudonocardia sp.]
SGTGLILAMWTSEVAKRAGVNPQTLRYYERRGILPMPQRTPAGYRDYPDSTVGLVRFIKRSQDLGYSLTDIAQLLQLADSGAASCAHARAITAARMADLDRRIEDLRRMRQRLTAMGAVCHGPGPGRLCRLMVETVETINQAGIDRDDELCACS